jgi:hypothetical protein
MSVKSCQLCGKPLGRMRVGGDGDFCSREHRNQFRLRRGMDRLQEANQVATLMRRRENPRQIPMAQLAAPGVTERRGSLDSTPFPAHRAAAGFPVLSPAAFQPRRPAERAQSFSDPLSDLLRRSSHALPRVMTPAALPFAAPATPRPLLAQRVIWKPAASVRAAPAAVLPGCAPAHAETPRGCGAALHMARSPLRPACRFDTGAAGSDLLQRSKRFQLTSWLVAAPSAQRTFPGVPFPKRAAALRGWESPASVRRGLKGTPRPRVSRPSSLDIDFGPSFCKVPLPEKEVCLRTFRPERSAAGICRPGILPVGHQILETGPRRPANDCQIRWDAAASARSLGLHTNGHRKTALPGHNSFRAHFPPASACDGHRLAEVPFAPADSSFDYPSIALHGSLPSAPAERSKRTAAAPIEEHFNAGLENWTGDTADWKLDAAGARAAGLALFRPTVGMSDYEFEFFSRIENHGVTFVFRASNLSNYLKVTIALAESGKYELRRCAVIGGVDEPAAIVPLGAKLRSNAAFTVKTRAKRNDFSISLDGEVVARWTDGRVPVGGVGFLAPRGDRARIYWLRVSNIDGSNSGAAPSRPAGSIE